MMEYVIRLSAKNKVQLETLLGDHECLIGKRLQDEELSICDLKFTSETLALIAAAKEAIAKAEPEVGEK